jgi:hypothetical protein
VANLELMHHMQAAGDVRERDPLPTPTPGRLRLRLRALASHREENGGRPRAAPGASRLRRPIGQPLRVRRHSLGGRVSTSLPRHVSA